MTAELDGPPRPPRFLEGIHVVDLSTGVAGPYATRLLAWLGATVSGVTWAEPAAPFSDVDAWLAAGKREVRLDGRSAAGREAVSRLLAEADVLVESFTPSQRRAWGLESRALAATHPHLVVARLTGLGETWPWAGEVGSELLWQAAGGWSWLTGEPDREPLPLPGFPASCLTGAHAAAVTCAALFEGGGREVEVSAVEAVADALEGALTGYGLDGTVRQRSGARHHAVHPMGIVRCRDGYVALCVASDGQWPDFARFTGLAALAAPELATAAGRLRHRNAVDAALGPWAARFRRRELFAATQLWRFPSTPVLTPTEVCRDRHVRAAGWLVQDEDRAALAGPIALRTGHAATTEPAPRKLAVEPRAAGGGTPALAGVRVIDLTAVWSGPYATRLLADLGAVVVKVESPARPDGTRHPPGTGRGGPGGLFLELNRGKYGVALDLAAAHDRDRFLALLRQSDVVIDNFSPRVMPNLGLADDVLRRVNPGLIRVTMPAFGGEGPYAHYVAYGRGLEAMSGLMPSSGYVGGHPMPAGCAISDALAGVHACLAAVAALYARSRGHGASAVEVSQWASALQWAGAELVIAASGGAERAHATGTKRPGPGPWGLFRCRDGWVAVAALTGAQQRALARLLGGGQPAPVPAPPGRAALEDALVPWLRERDAGEAATALGAADVPAAPVLAPDQIVRSPLLAARDFWVAVPVAGRGRVRVPGPPWCSAGWRPADGPAPDLGQHGTVCLGNHLPVAAP